MKQFCLHAPTKPAVPCRVSVDMQHGITQYTMGYACYLHVLFCRICVLCTGQGRGQGRGQGGRQGRADDTQLLESRCHQISGTLRPSIRCAPGCSVVVEADTHARRVISANDVTDLHQLHTLISYQLRFSSRSAQQQAITSLRLAKTPLSLSRSCPGTTCH